MTVMMNHNRKRVGRPNTPFPVASALLVAAKNAATDFYQKRMQCTNKKQRFLQPRLR